MRAMRGYGVPLLVGMSIMKMGIFRRRVLTFWVG